MNKANWLFWRMIYRKESEEQANYFMQVNTIMVSGKL